MVHVDRKLVVGEAMLVIPSIAARAVVLEDVVTLGFRTIMNAAEGAGGGVGLPMRCAAEFSNMRSF